MMLALSSSLPNISALNHHPYKDLESRNWFVYSRREPIAGKLT